MIETGKCGVCGKACQPLVSANRPRSSEWYCEKCHKSFPMASETASKFLRDIVKEIREKP